MTSRGEHYESGSSIAAISRYFSDFGHANRNSFADSVAMQRSSCRPFKLVAVALANTMARITFAIMRGKTTYSAAPA